MNKIKDDSGFCIHCEIEMLDSERIDCKCPKCGNDDFEDLLTEEWAALSDDERDSILQDEEDNNWYNSVRM